MTSSLAPSWADSSLRRFRWMLALVGVGFLATEAAALSGGVPHLRPVSFQEITANILFAIGFGCPLVLYLSSLPRLREVGLMLAAGLVLALVLWQVHQWLGLPAGLDPHEVAAAQLITALGLASLGVLGVRAWRSTGEGRTWALLYLLPSSVALVYTLEAGLFLYFIKAVFPTTLDAYAYAADAAHGVQLSFVVGRLFAAVPLLRLICFAIYVAPPPALIFVYALQTRARRPPPVDVVTVLLVAAVLGYACYFLYPVCGPLFAFGSDFPSSPPPVEDLLGRRLTITNKDAWPNGVPSLHMASVVLAYWHARFCGRWARAAALVFVLGTFLATLGLGEHYFVDLVVALPFSLAVHAGCMPGRPAFARQRRLALGVSLGLFVLWYLLLRWGISFLLLSPVLAWTLSLSTVAAVVWLEWRLYQAIRAEAGAPSIRLAPTPPGRFLVGNLQEFRRDVLGLLLESQRAYGDVVRFRLGPLVLHLVSHPDHIRHVLLAGQDRYNKDTRSSAVIRSITGEGLLTSNGDFWLRQRRLMKPPFQPHRLVGFLDIMNHSTAALCERWGKHADEGRPLDVASEMMALTFTIVGKALFGADLGGEAETVERASTVVLEHVYARLEHLLEPPAWMPTQGNRRFNHALAELDRIVHRLIAERRRQGGQSHDLLSILLDRCDEETGQSMTDAQLRNETITLLLAGHETTANALTWTWYLLSQHPEARRRLAAEVAGVLGERMPTAEDLPRLSYTGMVLRESLRLYPPIWIMERRALVEDTIAGFTIPAGSSMLVSPYVTHRLPQFWPDPERFDPERFTPEASEGRNPHVYIPFGLGQRLCIGSHFALMEAQVILALVSQRFRLELVPGSVVEPQPGITLRTRHGLPMTVHRVSSNAEDGG